MQTILDVLLLSELGSEAQKESAIIVKDNDRHAPFLLTDAQYAYWIGRSGELDFSDVSRFVYLEADVKNLDLQRFSMALNRLIQRHEMLRAVIDHDGRQRIQKKIPDYIIVQRDLRSLSKTEKTTRLEELRQQLSHQKLSAETGPLFTIQASLLTKQISRLHIGFDLLIGDGWSFGLLLQDLVAWYDNPSYSPDTIEASFRDYVLAEQKKSEAEQYKVDAEYWAKRIDTLPPGPVLPVVQNSKTGTPGQFERIADKMGSQEWKKLKEIGASRGLTPSAILLADFAEVLSLWSGYSDFTINLTNFNRPANDHTGLSKVVGDFTTLTLLEVKKAQGSFEERAILLQEQLWNDLEHREYGAVAILRQLRALGRSSEVFFPVVFTSLLPLSAGDGGFCSLGKKYDNKVSIEYCISQTPQVWLDHQVYEKHGELRYHWGVVLGLFPDKIVESMFQAYSDLLIRLCSNETTWTEAFPCVLPKQQLEKRAYINLTDHVFPDALLHTVFLEQCLKNPDAKAVITSSRSLTYAELLQEAVSVAGGIQQNVGMSQGLIGVLYPKGWKQIASVLGVLLAGKAYLPLDVGLPPARIAAMLKHAGAEALLADNIAQKDLLLPDGCLLLNIESSPSFELNDLINDTKSDELAYVIYTSGSTGTPKGVAITHAAAWNTIVDINRRFAVSSDDCVFALSRLNFGLSVYDIFGLLSVGGEQ